MAEHAWPTASLLEAEPILRVRDLAIDVMTSAGAARAVDGVSFDVERGQRFGLIGESGSGKTLTLRAIAGLLPRGAQVVGGEIWLNGKEVARLDPSARRRARIDRVGMIFQEPMNALNPVMRVGEQIAEGPQRVLGRSAEQARDMALALMGQMGIPDPQRRYRAFPHELSGGLRQRVMIAIALSLEPVLVLCDEPTTALDVTVQDQILRLLRQITAERDRSLVYVTHDLAVVAQVCDEVAVMYAGRLMEQGRSDQVLRVPHHPYTLGLRQCIPDIDHADGPLIPIRGVAPAVGTVFAGCRFVERCDLAEEDCEQTDPQMVATGPDRTAACLHHDRCRELAGKHVDA